MFLVFFVFVFLIFALLLVISPGLAAPAFLGTRSFLPQLLVQGLLKSNVRQLTQTSMETCSHHLSPLPILDTLQKLKFLAG